MPTTFDVESADGTLLRAWQDDGDADDERVPLLLSNGLGTIPESWPGLVGRDSGYRTVTWYYRGTFGSQRPADPARVRIEDHVDDAIAVMDAAGVERALVACWSIGVNIGFELALRHPERVAGLMAVAGVPGGTFSTMGGPLRIPRPLRHVLATGVARWARAIGPALTWVAHRVPVDERTAWLVTHSGFMLPAARTEVVEPMLREFVRQDWKWYFHLAVAASEHRPMDVSSLECPVTLLAGRHDVLTSMHDVVDAAARIPHAQITVLPGSHFLPMEHPELVQVALDELARRSDLGPPARPAPRSAGTAGTSAALS
ncbi:MAG: alpha/beta fold hydrolase [Actinomycetes bacterium]